MKAAHGMAASRFPSAVTRIAVTVLLTAAVIFVLVSCRDPGYARLRVAGATAPSGMHRNAATFVVAAAPFSQIALSVNGHRVASAYVPWNAREVGFDRVPLSDGNNVVVARTTLWYAASKWDHSAALHVENPPARAVERAPAPIGSRSGRSLTLEVRQRALAAAFAVQLPRSDPAIVALRGGRIDLPAFVDDVFGTPRFDSKPIAAFFAGVRARFYAAGDTVTVSASSDDQRLLLEELPAFAGDVEIANDFSAPAIRVAGSGATDRRADARQWAYDTLRLDVHDYRIVARRPEPQRMEGSAIVWERPFAQDHGDVSVSLAFVPFSSVDALRRGLNLPVFAFAPHIVARFLALSHGFILAVPMFAYLVLSGGRNVRLATVARRLIAVAVAADVFDACISAQPDVDGEILLIVPALRALPPSLVNLVVVPVVIGLVLALLAACVAHLGTRLRSRIGTIVSDGTSGVRVAALGFAAIAVLGYATGRVAHVPAVYPALVGAAFAVGLVALLASLDWWTIPGRGAWRGAFTVATLAFAVAVAVPISLVSFGAWVASPEHAGTAIADPLSPLPLSAAFLRSLAPLCPLAFGLLLIVSFRRDATAVGLRRSQFVRLVLCSYAVLAGVVVLVPVGYVLAWSTFNVLRRREIATNVTCERGGAAIALACAFVVVEALLLLPSEAQFLRTLHTPFIALEATDFVAVIAASLVLPAFAFAACSDELAGDSTLRKGLNVGVWAIACSLPALFLRSDSLPTAVAVVLVTGLFYAMLGRVTSGPAAHMRMLGIPWLSMNRT